MEEESVSLVDLAGIMSPILFVISILLGIMAIFLRRNTFNKFTILSLLGIGFLGISLTGLYFFNTYAHLSPTGACDPTMMLYVEGKAWGRCGITCFGVSIGLVMTAIAVVLTKQKSD